MQTLKTVEITIIHAHVHVYAYCSPSPSPVSGRVASHGTCVVLYAEPLGIVGIPDQSKHLKQR